MIDNLTETLTQLRDEAYNDAKEKGLLDKGSPDSHWFALMSADIAAAALAEEAGEHVNQYGYDLFARDDDDNEDFIHNYSCFIKDTMEDKIASACIRILAFMGMRDFAVTYRMDGLVSFITEKIDKSEAFTKVVYSIWFAPSVLLEGHSAAHCLTLAAILAYCELHGIDILRYIELRMAYNRITE